MILQRIRSHSGVLALASRLLGASVLAQVAVLAAIALVSRDLQPRDFALYGAVSGAAGIAASINTMAAETRTPVVDDQTSQVLNRAGFTTLTAISLLTVIAGLVAWPLSRPVGWVLVLSALCAWCTGSQQLLNGIVLRRQLQKVLADGRVSQGLSNAVLLIVLWQLGVPGFLVLVLAWLLSLLIGVGVVYHRGARGHLPRAIASQEDLRVLRHQVGGQPVANLLSSSVSSMPPLLLPAVGQHLTAGIWALVSRFLNPVVNTTFATLQPLYYGEAAEHVRHDRMPQLRQYHRRWMTAMVLAGIPFALGSVVITMYLLPLLGPQWKVGWLPALTGAIYYTAMFSCLPLSQTLQMLGRIRLALRWTVVRCIVSLAPLALIGLLGGQRALLGWAIGAAATFYWQFWLHRTSLRSEPAPRRRSLAAHHESPLTQEESPMSDQLPSPARSLAEAWLPAIRRSLGWVLALTLVGALAGALAAKSMPKSYEASTQMILLPASGKDSGEIASSTTVAKSLASSYAHAITSTSVLTKVLATTGSSQSVADLQENISTIVQDDTVVIDLTVEDESAEGAAKLANAISTEFIKQSPTLMPKQTRNAAVLELKPLRVATPPASPSSPGMRALVPIGAFLGLSVGLAAAVLRPRPKTTP
ncbi:Wzz/FepE/Etk N-terminal domain-containing protein [Luteococcus sp. OSA5]|uniref:Wzz/FepE/Etk N-terminal domain-containing protein n=1 Tax=Luteococcus sp. OSA5 TaxID=3401630 RepID=UPI003B43A94F